MYSTVPWQSMYGLYGVLCTSICTSTSIDTSTPYYLQVRSTSTIYKYNLQVSAQVQVPVIRTSYPYLYLKLATKLLRYNKLLR